MKSNIWQVRRFLSRKRNARLSNENLAFKKPYKKHAMMNIIKKASQMSLDKQEKMSAAVISISGREMR